MKFRFVLLGPDDDPDRRAAEAAAGEPTSGLYAELNGGIVRLTGEGCRTIPVTNFRAIIIRDIVLDDGEEQHRQFGIEADLSGQHVAFTIPAADFGRMGWVLRELGPHAVIYPSQQQHARAAIQVLSGEIRQERVFAHTGWRRLDENWAYLHGGGAIDKDGPLPGVKVALPDQLSRFELPLPPKGEQLTRAVGAILRLLDVAPDRITIPLLAAVYRAALGGTDFSLFLTGRTGVFKTALALLDQQHFGARIDTGTLPGNFSSTANALEMLAFYAKDLLLTVDDFAPGSVRDAELEGVAERLFRGAGNKQARSRMGADGRLRPYKPARALVLATGEAVPHSQSVRARMLIVEIAPGDVDVEVLSACQRAATEGLFCQAMAGFIQWVAGRYEQILARHRERVRELRDASPAAAHARTPGILAELQAGFELLLAFATEVGAVTAGQAETLATRARDALAATGAAQAAFQHASDPALRFIDLLKAALAAGCAHVANRMGGVPDQPERWGWRCTDSGWYPAGIRVGWVDGNDLYLESDLSYEVAQRQAGKERIPLTERTLRSRLSERGLLASIDTTRETLKVRRTLEGSGREVLHLKPGILERPDAG